ncbi:hypothetical protein F5X97DRAFT_306291 [Nemania serpens]|nr:hypothetical protein F5X97DRAFT_306291 [Nemania serpens]
MPPPRRRLDELQHDLWAKNKTTLRRLYLKERKRLEDVKKVMESEHGFPTTPLSTYESKLRDLGLRKKMKKTDWHSIYQHYVNSDKKHTAMSFNGTKIPWEKAWKEIRRSGARQSNIGHGIGLPADVIMRTPSPILVASRFTPCFWAPVPWELGDVALADLSPAAVVHRSKLYDIPSNRLRIEMLDYVEKFLTGTNVAGAEPRSLSDASYPLRDSTNSSIEYAMLDWAVTVPQQGSNCTGIHSDIDRLSSALYQLANHDYIHGFVPRGPIDVVLNLTPRHVLLKLLESDSPVIRAAFDNLTNIVSYLHEKGLFFGLVQIVWHFRAKWTFTDKYLRMAARYGCVDSCRLLLQTRDGSEGEPSRSLCGREYVDAFNEYVARGHGECAKILFQHVTPINTAQIWVEGSSAHTIFAHFILTVATGPHFSYGMDKPTVLHMLDWFLEADVDVDLPFPQHILSSYYIGWPMSNIYTKWRLSILDFVYYTNSSLYSRLAAHSIESGTEATRSGIRRSAKEGLESLRKYLHSRTSHTPAQQDELVDILLTEDLLMSYSNFHTDLDFNVIHTLLHYNIDSLAFRLRLNMSEILNCIVGATMRQGMHPVFSEIVKTLTRKGAEIVAETMHAAVEAEGTALLQLLSVCGADFKNQGALALSTAARLGNYDAIDWLLEIGLDINATLWHNWMEGEVTILASASVCSYDGTQLLSHNPRLRDRAIRTGLPLIDCEMFQYLISRGAKLRTTPTSYSIQRLLYCIIKDGFANNDWAGTFGRVRSLLLAEPSAVSQSYAAPFPAFIICALGTVSSSAGVLLKILTTLKKLAIFIKY